MLVLFQYNMRGQTATWSTCCFSNSHKVFLSADSHRRVPEGEKMSPCSCQHCYVWRKFSELIGSAFLPNQHAVEISGWLEELCHIAMSPWPWVPVCAGCWVSLDTALEQVEIKVGRGRQVLLTHWWLFGVLWFCLFFFPFFPHNIWSLKAWNSRKQSRTKGVLPLYISFICLSSLLLHLCPSKGSCHFQDKPSLGK